MTTLFVPPQATVRRLTREPDPAWIVALADACASLPDHPDLRLIWEPGVDASVRGFPNKVERWFVYQCNPVDEGTSRLGLWDELRGPSPAAKMRYDSVLKRYVPLDDRDYPFISQLQWELYQQTGLLGVPFWVIQGTHGGHQLTFSEAQRQICRHKKLPEDPPYPGTLPYAPFDQRVVAGIRRMVEWKMRGASMHDQHEKWRFMDKRDAREIRDLMLAEVEDCFTFEDAMEVEGAMSNLNVDRPTVDVDEEKVWDREARRFVETDVPTL